MISGTAEVESFLKAVGLSQYFTKLTELGYDTLEALADMDDRHMREAGLRPGHCLMLHRRLRESNAQGRSIGLPAAASVDLSAGHVDSVKCNMPDKSAKPQRKRVCVIGAGPSGTSVLRAFMSAREKGAEIPEIVCYEKQPDLGGLWNFSWRTGLDEFGEAVHNSQYRHLWSNGPKECLEFADYSFEDHFGKVIPSYPPREVLRDYIVGRIEKSGVKRWVRCNTVVRQCTYDEQSEKFEVKVKDLETGDEVTEQFSYVCVCSGHFSTPNVPNFEGLQTFTGRCMHAHDFRSAEEFAGMRLLVVGTSYSAEDIASQCYKYGVKSVHCSWRTRPMNFRWPSNFTTVPLLTKVQGRTCTFKDGSRAEIDVIIMCTGYRHHFPFMQTDLRLQTANRLWINSLHEGIVWPTNTKLFYLGMQDQWFTFNMFDAQAWWARDVILGRIRLASLEVRQNEWQKWRDSEEKLDGTDESCIRFQAAYVKSLIQQTDYRMFDIEGVVRTFLDWERNKHNNIMTFRDKPHRSLMTGKMATVHHTPWLQAFNDSIECYINNDAGCKVHEDDIISLRQMIERQEAELQSLRAKLLWSNRCMPSAGALCDMLDLISAAIWLVGCVLFLPQFSKFLTLGCVLFMIGEWGYIGIGLHNLRHALRGPGIVSSAAWEAIGCLVGGTSFFIGTTLFLPDQIDAPIIVKWIVNLTKNIFSGPSLLLNLPGDAEEVETAGPAFEGAMFFIAGGFAFSMSSFFNAMGLEGFITTADRLAVASAILHMGGSLLFVCGSVGFVGQVGCGNRMVAFGSWSYLTGCALFIFGALVALSRHSVASSASEDHKLGQYQQPLINGDKSRSTSTLLKPLINSDKSRGTSTLPK